MAMHDRESRARARRARLASLQTELQTDTSGPDAAEQEMAQQAMTFVDVLAELLDGAESSPPSPQSQGQQPRAYGPSVQQSHSPEAAANADVPSTEDPYQPQPEAAPPQAVSHRGDGTLPAETAAAQPPAAPDQDVSPDVHPDSNLAPEPPSQTSPPSPDVDPIPLTLDTQAARPDASETTALVLRSQPPLQAAPGGGADTPVDAETVGSELDNLRTLLVGLEEQFYDPDKLVRLLLPSITEAIRDRLKQRNSAIASVLRSEMAIPIEEQIAVERDAIIDALYPVIGSTLAEYFTETLRTINHRVAGGTGPVASAAADAPDVSGPSPEFGIQALVLVHRATGLLLAQAIAAKELTRTAHRRAELLTAIRSSAAAHLEQPRVSGPVGQYRQGQILIESNDLCYLAALAKGDPPVSFLQRMGHTLDALVTDHRGVIAAFEGDTDAVPTSIPQRLHRLLRTHTGTKPRHRPAKLVGLGLLLLGGIAASIWGLQELRDRRLGALAADVDRTVALLNQGSGVSITARTSENQVILEGNVLQFNSIDDIRQSFEEIPGVEAVIDRIESQPSMISTQIYFYPNSASLSPRDIANKIVTVSDLLEQYPEFNLRVIGYRNPVDEADTPALALDRAIAVADALADQGISRQRLEIVEAEDTPPGINVERQPWLSQAVLFEMVPPLRETTSEAGDAEVTAE